MENFSFYFKITKLGASGAWSHYKPHVSECTVTLLRSLRKRNSNRTQCTVVCLHECDLTPPAPERPVPPLQFKVKAAVLYLKRSVHILCLCSCGLFYSDGRVEKREINTLGQ